MPGQDNGSRIIARKSLTTGLFSSNKAFPNGYAVCCECDMSSVVCMCVFACAHLNLNMLRSPQHFFLQAFRDGCLIIYHPMFLLMTMKLGGKGK